MEKKNNLFPICFQENSALGMCFFFFYLRKSGNTVHTVKKWICVRCAEVLWKFLAVDSSLNIKHAM